MFHAFTIGQVIHLFFGGLVFQDLEIPIVTYKRFTNGQIALDESVCTKEDEEKCKKAIAKHSPFKNDLSIGAQFAKIEKTGTNIFVYNLEQWDGNCIAEWSENKTIKSEEMAKEKELPGDIKIPSRRLRVRAGQTSQQVLTFRCIGKISRSCMF